MTPTMADRLALVETGDDGFVSRDPADDRRVFGGLLIGQALRAAQQTVTAERPAHSLHASFVDAGTGGEPIRYDVERTRDGSSFTTRRVVARQERGVVLVLTADFHHDEPGVEYEAPAPEGVPGPEGLEVGRYDSSWFEARDVPVGAGPGGAIPHARGSWFRPNAPVPDDPLLHIQALAYLSDHGPTRAAREPHAGLADDARRLSVSLDHSVWFHRPVDVNQWLLSQLVPVATGRGRGLSLGTIRTADGDLLATVAQEVLLRTR
ncbi:MAG: acyl-CoA thioesterase domain-containing protein [Ilumatobacteraceae bacterium]